MVFVGCQKNGDLKDKLNNSESAIVYGIVPELIYVDEPDTKGVYIDGSKIDFKWLVGLDAINVFSDNKGEVMSYLVKSVDESNPRLCKFEVRDFSLAEGVKYYSFFPTTRSMDPKAVPVDYAYQRQFELNDGSHLSDYSFFVSDPLVEKAGEEASFSYKYRSSFVRFVVTPYVDFTAQKITIKSDTPDAFITKGKIDVTTGIVSADKTSATVVLYLGEPEEGLEMTGGVTYYAYMAVNNPIAMSGLTATVSGVDSYGNEVTFSRVISAERKYEYSYTNSITIKQEAPQPEETESDITGTTVDLGEWK